MHRGGGRTTTSSALYIYPGEILSFLEKNAVITTDGFPDRRDVDDKQPERLALKVDLILQAISRHVNRDITVVPVHSIHIWGKWLKGGVREAAALPGKEAVTLLLLSVRVRPHLMPLTCSRFHNQVTRLLAFSPGGSLLLHSPVFLILHSLSFRCLTPQYGTTHSGLVIPRRVARSHWRCFAGAFSDQSERARQRTAYSRRFHLGSASNT